MLFLNKIYHQNKIYHNMINLQIKLETLKNEYPRFYEFFKDALNHSQSRFKDYKEDK